jgi:hypothetical protein
MGQVVILSLADGAGRAGCGGDACGCGAAEAPRVPVLSCADALRRGGERVEVVTACEDAEIDTAIKPVEAGDARLVVAAASDGEVRAVVRRLVRRYAPPPSKRPADLPPNRTVFDLPPLAVLPLSPGMPDLVDRLDLPAEPDAVAAAVAGGRTRRLDLLRTDAGSVTLHGSMLAGIGGSGSAAGWRGRIEVDDAVLSDGAEPLLACSIRNAGSSAIHGLPLAGEARPDDGMVQVAVAVPILRRRLLREAEVRYEVRRARGRAVSVTPRVDAVELTDDGVTAELTRKRSWWVEPGAWAVYVM